MSSEAGLAVAGLRVEFDSTVAVAGADLRVDSGEIVGLLGPSGCGKSSLLRAIAGLVPITAGTITWQGRDLTRLPAHRRQVGLMFQDHALFPHRNVLDNVAFGLRMQGVGARQRRARAEELLELVGLARMGERTIGTLSGGQAQRVALARALAPEPGLLLLDEPLASLDRALRDRLAGEIRAIVRAAGTTAVYVTHDQDEAVTVADRLAIMSRGRILVEGTIDDLRSNPRSASVAEALALDNVWKARVTESLVATPWGSVAPTGLESRHVTATAAKSGALPVMLPVRSVTVASAGEPGVPATVTGRLRRGDAWLLRCEITEPADCWVVTAWSADLVGEGETVSLSADLARLVVLEP